MLKRDQENDWVGSALGEPETRTRANASSWLRENPGYRIGSKEVARLQAVQPPSVIERLDALLLGIVGETSAVGQQVELDRDEWIVRTWSIDSNEVNSLLDLLVEQNLIKATGSIYDDRSIIAVVNLTADGWKRAEQLQRSPSTSNQVFVAMSFADEMRPVLDDGIVPAIEDTGFRPYVVGGDSQLGKIDDEIISEIRKSRFIVVDLTGQRPSVYYEAGFGHGRDIPILFTCREDELHEKEIHFDIRQYNCIGWSSPEDLKEKLENRIRANFAPS